MPLVNNFLVGADPEFVLLEDGKLQQYRGKTDKYAPWGLDHGFWVIEPHPKPERSVRQLVQNLKVAMNDFATVTPGGKWRAGAYVRSPQQRSVTLGGHVHLDITQCSREQMNGLNLFSQHLEALDILPATESVKRRESGLYGQLGDVRYEHGHFEYRTMPSWLYSQRATKICLAGTKLIAVDPAAPTETLGTVATASIPKLKALFERFRHKDEDADWLLSSRIFDKKLVVDPDRDLRTVWKVHPEAEKPRWKEEEAKNKKYPDAVTTGRQLQNQIGANQLTQAQQAFLNQLAQDQRVRIAHTDPHRNTLANYLG